MADGPKRWGLLLVGPPGCGKGTQGARISKKYRADLVVMSDLLTQETTKGTPEGRELEPYRSAGRLVPNTIIVPIIKRAIDNWAKSADSEASLVLDGFCRTPEQFEAAVEALCGAGFTPMVLFFGTPLDVARQRMIDRKRPGEESPEIVDIRIRQYVDSQPALIRAKAQSLRLPGARRVASCLVPDDNYSAGEVERYVDTFVRPILIKRPVASEGLAQAAVLA